MASDTHYARRAVRHADTLFFPPLHRADDPHFHNPILQHPLIHRPHLPIPAPDDEMILVPESMLPAPADADSDTLPSEQHPSFLFGNPYHIHHGPHTLQPLGSSQPKLSPRLHTKLALHAAEIDDEALAAVTTGSENAHAAIAPQRRIADGADGEDDIPVRAFTTRRDGSTELAMHLRMQAQTATTTQTPQWPFRRFGPGPSARPYAALFRADYAAHTYPEVDVWADFALERLTPTVRADSYTLPASLQHPYIASGAAHRARARPRPSAIPVALGRETAQRDELWLDNRGDMDSDNDGGDDDAGDELGDAADLSVLGSARGDPFAYVPAAAPPARRHVHSDVFDESTDAGRGGLFAHAHKSGRARMPQEELDFRRTLLAICRRKARTAKRAPEAAEAAAPKKARSEAREDASVRVATRAPSGSTRVPSAHARPPTRGVRINSRVPSQPRRPAGWEWGAG